MLGKWLNLSGPHWCVAHAACQEAKSPVRWASEDEGLRFVSDEEEPLGSTAVYELLSALPSCSFRNSWKKVLKWLSFEVQLFVET